VVHEIEELHKLGQAEGHGIAAIYAALGEKDKAFEWLDKDIANRSSSVPQFRWFLVSDQLRDDPRWKDFLRRMDLPE